MEQATQTHTAMRSRRELAVVHARRKHSDEEQERTGRSSVVHSPSRAPSQLVFRRERGRPTLVQMETRIPTA